MVGNKDAEKISEYLSRLTGDKVDPTQSIKLRSVHRAALIAWTRKECIPINLEKLGRGEPFRLDLLLVNTADVGSGSAGKAIPPFGNVQAVSNATVNSEVFRHQAIGIDIEEVDSLPAADDYREHSFYHDNFTPEEIAYCIRQNDPRASFCGTWAAKEAVLKAGLTSAPASLRHVGIGHDVLGRPFYESYPISISHTAKIAVAICIAPASQVSELSRPEPSTAKAEQGPAVTPSDGTPASKKFCLPWWRALQSA